MKTARDVAITGVGVVPRMAGADRPFHEVAFQAAQAAMADAGIGRGDIDSVVLAGLDVECGRTITNMYVSPAAGGYLKDEIRVGDDGLYAAALAWMRVRSGLFDTAIVLGYGISSEGPSEQIANLVFDPVYQRPFGLGRLLPLALQANAYRRAHDDVDARADAAAAASAAAAARDATAVPRAAAADGFAAPPLKHAHVAPLVDGAAAVVLQAAPFARRGNVPPVRFLGCGWSAESGDLGQRDLASFKSTKDAAVRAFKTGGVTAADVTAAELHDVTAYHRVMAEDALALPASAAVNATGGSFGGEASVASGLYRFASSVQAARRGGIALTHSVGGPAAQMACVGLVGGWDA